MKPWLHYARPDVDGWVFFVILGCAVGGRALSGCGETPAPPSPPAPPQVQAVSPPEPVAPAAPPEGGYTLSLKVASSGDCGADLTISTNMPGTVEVSASVEQAGMKGDDLYIGLSRNIKFHESITAHFDGRSKSDLPSGMEALPDGKYVGTVTLFPNWGLADDAAKLSGLTTELNAKTKSITLTCGGRSAAALNKLSAKQLWVMGNVVSGTPWNPTKLTRQLGEYEEVPMTGEGNPNILKFYYFPAADMTLMVNVLKAEVVTYRMGRAGA